MLKRILWTMPGCILYLIGIIGVYYYEPRISIGCIRDPYLEYMYMRYSLLVIVGIIYILLWLMRIWIMAIKERRIKHKGNAILLIKE